MTNQSLIVAGVDTHKDTHYAAVITVTGEHIGAAEFPATDAGYRALTGFITCHGALLHTGVEGTNSYGAGPTRHLQNVGIEVVEVIRPARQVRRMHGKSENLDAYTAAHTALANNDTVDIYLDRASGAKASRPELDKALASANRTGDQLIITRLDRLGRSLLHFVTLGAALKEQGVGLRVLEQCIDTSTAEGRAMLGMLSVLAELQRKLIIANTRDGLAAARARGRKGGRRPNSPPSKPATLKSSTTPATTPCNRSRPPQNATINHLRPPQQRKHRPKTTNRMTCSTPGLSGRSRSLTTQTPTSAYADLR